MDTKKFSQREMESAIEIAHMAGQYGFRTQNSRDAMSNFIDWAIEFEKQPYEDDMWLELIDSFAEEKMMQEVKQGYAMLSDKRLLDKILAGMDSIQSEFNPTTPEGYTLVLGDTELALKYQDTLDAFFQERIIDVRNALREHGWHGEQFHKRLQSPDNHTSVEFVPAHIGNGRNVIGGKWEIRVNGERPDNKPRLETIDTIMDGLAQGPSFVANLIHKKSQECTPEKSFIAAGQLASGKLDVYAADPSVDNKYAGKILGVTNFHVVQNLGRIAIIFKKSELDHIPAKDELVTIDYKNGRATVNQTKAHEKCSER